MKKKKKDLKRFIWKDSDIKIVKKLSKGMIMDEPLLLKPSDYVSMILEKAGNGSEGEIRHWKSGDYKKVGKKWVRQKKAGNKKEKEFSDKSFANGYKEGRYGTKKATSINTTKGMYHSTKIHKESNNSSEKVSSDNKSDSKVSVEMLKKEVAGRQVFQLLDDVKMDSESIWKGELEGDQKGQFDYLEKEQLIEWKEQGKDEYNPVLTKKGKEAYKAGNDYKKKGKK